MDHAMDGSWMVMNGSRRSSDVIDRRVADSARALPGAGARAFHSPAPTSDAAMASDGRALPRGVRHVEPLAQRGARVVGDERGVERAVGAILHSARPERHAARRERELELVCEGDGEYGGVVGRDGYGIRGEEKMGGNGEGSHMGAFQTPMDRGETCGRAVGKFPQIQNCP